MNTFHSNGQTDLKKALSQAYKTQKTNSTNTPISKKDFKTKLKNLKKALF